MSPASVTLPSGNTKGGSITVPLTSCLTGLALVCFANKNKNCQLSYTLFQTSQTGGHWYNDTSPFSIPCFHHTLGNFLYDRQESFPMPQNERQKDQSFLFFQTIPTWFRNAKLERSNGATTFS
jgi:hypothetical protein